MPQIKAEMSGTITKVMVNKGAKVSAEQDVIGMESMKMEMFVQSPFAGSVTEIHVKVGDFVNEGDPLLTLS
jgi:biotin carboxyl carrier protein